MYRYAGKKPASAVGKGPDGDGSVDAASNANTESVATGTIEAKLNQYELAVGKDLDDDGDVGKSGGAVY